VGSSTRRSEGLESRDFGDVEDPLEPAGEGTGKEPTFPVRAGNRSRAQATRSRTPARCLEDPAAELEIHRVTVIWGKTARSWGM